MKGNVACYGLKPFPTEYEYLDNEYLNIDLAKEAPNLWIDSFFPKKLIEEGRTKRLIWQILTEIRDG